MNIASTLVEMADRQPHTLAVLFPQSRDAANRVAHTHFTYQQLDRESDRYAAALLSQGIGPGTRTVLMVKPSLEFFALTFALFKTGAVPVLVDPGMGVKNLGKCLAEAQPKAFIGIPEAQLARKILGWARHSLKTVITVGRSRLLGGITLHSLLRNLEPDSTTETYQASATETAAILFTSGSTGIPKGVVYTHAIFLRQVELLKTTYGIEPGEVDLCTFPLFALFAPGLGMTAVIPDMDFTRPAQVDPRNVFGPIEDFGVTNMFGSPALIRRVGQFGVEKGLSLPTLKRVISAGAPVPATVLETFASMLTPDAQIFTPYGATESLPVCSIGSQEILSETRTQTDRGKGVCVGHPVDGVRVEVIRISDDVIETWSDDLRVEDGEIGEIAVQGINVTREYFGRTQSTSLAKIADPKTDSFLHRMGDVGYRDDRGRIWFCGRKSHRVKLKDETLFTIPCEAVFNTHPHVFRTALVGVNSGDQTRPVLCVELEKETSVRPDVVADELKALGGLFEHTKRIETILFHPSFPVDIRHNAKIFREKLTVWAEKKLKGAR